MSKMLKKIETTKAPKAIGAYSQAIEIEVSQKLIFVSGQLPIDPLTGDLIHGDIKTLTRQVLKNLEAILVAAHSSLFNVVRMDIFLKDIKDFSAMNEEYALHMNPSNPPARQTVEVSGLPKGSPIEISCIAISSKN